MSNHVYTAVKGFETEEAMEEHYMADISHRDSILGGVVFVGLQPNSSGSLLPDLRFKVSGLTLPS